MKTQEYNNIISECRRFAKKEIQPVALDMDLAPDPAQMQLIWEKSHALDLPMLLIPESFGGAGYPDLCAALVLDTLASVCAGTASVFACHFAASAAARTIGNGEVIDHFSSNTNTPATIVFPDEMDEASLKMIQSGSDAILSGESSPAGNSQISKIFVVHTLNTQLGPGSPFLMVPADLPGLEIGSPLDLPGLKANSFAKIRFQDTAINDKALKDQKPAGGIIASPINAYYGFIAAMAMGVARKALELATAYAGERYQYGQKIICHQEIQRMLGAMQMKLGLGTAGYINLFESSTIRLSHFPADARLVKAFCTDAAMEITMDAIQIHGGYGYMHEYGLEKMMRDVKILQLIGGQTPCHHIRIVAEGL